MSEFIYREIWLTENRRIEPIPVTENSKIPIHLKVMDVTLSGTSAQAYSFNSKDSTYKKNAQNATIASNVVMLIPSSGFFLAGHDQLQINFPVSDGNYITKEINVSCSPDFSNGGSTPTAEDVKSLVERAEEAGKQVDAVNTAGANQINAITTKGAETLASIPADYSQLSASIVDLSAYNRHEYDMQTGIINTDGTVTPNDAAVAIKPIYLHKGNAIILSTQVFGMIIHYWADGVSSGTHEYISGRRYERYVCEKSGYYAVTVLNVSNVNLPISVDIVRGIFEIKNDNVQDNADGIGLLRTDVFGYKYNLNLLPNKQCGDLNRLTDVSGWSAVMAMYLERGAIMRDTDESRRYYIRAYGNDTSWSIVNKIGYKSGEYIVPESGYYSITMANDGSTFAITIPPADSAYFYTNILANDLALASDPRIMELTLPTYKGLGSYVEIKSGSDVECLIKYSRNGTYVEDKGTFYENTWAKKHAILHYLDCDAVTVRFRIYDGTSVHTLTDADKDTIISSIASMSVGTYRNTGEGKPITNNALETRLKGVSAPKESIISIAHQGYSYTETLGRSHLKGYKEVAKLGFEYGETDLKLTKDNVLVCCHDPSFVDATTKAEIIIAQNTLAELKACNYYGDKIATFEEVLTECKRLGLNLMIDHLTNELFDMASVIVKRHSMEHNVIWTLSVADTAGEGITSLGNHILAVDPCAKLMSVYGTSMNSGRIAALNALKTPNNTIICGVYDQLYTPEQIASLKEQLAYGIDMCVWSVDKLSAYLEYTKYCKYILSNEFSFRMICGAGLVY